MHNFAISGRNKITLSLVVLISISVLLLRQLGVFDEVDLHSHAEVATGYVKQWFNQPENVTEEVAPKVIAPDAVRIYIGIVTNSFDHF